MPLGRFLHSALVTASLGFLFANGCAKSTAVKPRMPDELVVRVLKTYPHDRNAFTQGLLFYDGKLYESTGLQGRSSVRAVQRESGVVLQQSPLSAAHFGEGLARVGGRLFQLTWQNGRALVWNLQTLKKEAEIPYEGEGWGLCFDGKRLIMSNGSAELLFRDSETFALAGRITVRRAGVPLSQLNELECINGLVYANVWQDHHIARIDPASGEVTGWIEAAGLLTSDEARDVDVLNGIAYLADTGHFLLTGKLWPHAFEVEFVPAPVRAAPAAW